MIYYHSTMILLILVCSSDIKSKVETDKDSSSTARKQQGSGIRGSIRGKQHKGCRCEWCKWREEEKDKNIS